MIKTDKRKLDGCSIMPVKMPPKVRYFYEYEAEIINAIKRDYKRVRPKNALEWDSNENSYDGESLGNLIIIMSAPFGNDVEALSISQAFAEASVLVPILKRYKLRILQDVKIAAIEGSLAHKMKQYGKEGWSLTIHTNVTTSDCADGKFNKKFDKCIP